MIVKVQLSLTTDHPQQQMLIYNEDGSVFFMGDATRAVKRVMRGSPKRYFHAEIDGNGKLTIDGRAPTQEW